MNRPRLALSAPLLVLLLLLAGCAARNAAHFDPNSVEVRTARVNGVNLAYRIVGHGPPLVMVMGYAGTMDVWDPTLVESLAASRTVVMFDNRGMGYSTTNDTPLTMESMASDTAGLMDALGIRKADILGWSMGSVITQELALSRPEKVGKIILYATATDPAPIREALDRMAAMNHTEFMQNLFPAKWRHQHPDIDASLPSASRPADPAMVGRQYQAVMAWPGTRHRLPRLECPALVVAGQEDTVTPIQQNLAVAELVKGAWLVRFTGAGHWLMYQTPRQLARIVLQFLDINENLLLRPQADSSF